MEMEAASSSSLRRRLRATVCCCFGLGYSGYGYRARRAGAGGEFRYDSLSYALNFDEGPDDDGLDDAGAGLLYRSFSSPPRTLARTPAAA